MSEREEVVAILLDEDNYYYPDWAPEVDVDAMADEVMRFLAKAKAEAWDEGIRAGIRCDGTNNPYRSPA